MGAAHLHRIDQELHTCAKAVSPADIEVMSPREAWHELIKLWTIAPLLIARAQGAFDDTMLTVEDVAKALNVSESQVRRSAATDPRWRPFAKKVGKVWRFKRPEFERHCGAIM